MPLNDILQVRVVNHRSDISQLGMIVRHWKITQVNVPEPTYQDIANLLDTQIGPVMRPAMNVLARYRGVGVQRVFPIPPSIEVFAVAAAGDGTVAGDALPPQVAGLESYKTALAGRKFRGRSYIPFPSETDSDASGAPNAAYLAVKQALGVILSSPFFVAAGGGSLSITPVVYHRVTRTSDNITTVVHGPLWATQRRRGRLGRQNIPPV